MEMKYHWIDCDVLCVVFIGPIKKYLSNCPLLLGFKLERTEPTHISSRFPDTFFASTTFLIDNKYYAVLLFIRRVIKILRKKILFALEQLNGEKLLLSYLIVQSNKHPTHTSRLSSISQFIIAWKKVMFVSLALN